MIEGPYDAADDLKYNSADSNSSLSGQQHDPVAAPRRPPGAGQQVDQEHGARQQPTGHHRLCFTLEY